MSSKVGGIARAPVWGANLSYKSSPKSQPILRRNIYDRNNLRGDKSLIIATKSMNAADITTQHYHAT